MARARRLLEPKTLNTISIILKSVKCHLVEVGGTGVMSPTSTFSTTLESISVGENVNIHTGDLFKNCLRTYCMDGHRRPPPPPPSLYRRVYHPTYWSCLHTRVAFFNNRKGAQRYRMGFLVLVFSYPGDSCH